MRARPTRAAVAHAPAHHSDGALPASRTRSFNQELMQFDKLPDATIKAKRLYGVM